MILVTVGYTYIQWLCVHINGLSYIWNSSSQTNLVNRLNIMTLKFHAIKELSIFIYFYDMKLSFYLNLNSIRQTKIGLNTICRYCSELWINTKVAPSRPLSDAHVTPSGVARVTVGPHYEVPFLHFAAVILVFEKQDVHTRSKHRR